MSQLPNPLQWNVPIVDKQGKPSPDFLRQWTLQRAINAGAASLTTADGVSAALDLISAIDGQILIRGTAHWAGKTMSGDATLVDTGEIIIPLRPGFGFLCGGLPADGELLGYGVLGADAVFPSVHNPFAAKALVAATATAVLYIGILTISTFTPIGTITFAVGSLTGVVAFTSPPYTLPAGTIIAVMAPSPVDATLYGITATVPGDA